MLSLTASSLTARVHIACANLDKTSKCSSSSANSSRARATSIVRASEGGQAEGDGRRGGRGGGRGGRGGRNEDPFTENVVQVSRVTKVTKGGSQMSFRATVVVGDGKGAVGVGCKKAKEVQGAVMKAASDARKSVVKVPIAKGDTFPHRVTVKGNGGAHVMLRPAAPGTGVIAGGSCRSVLELAGYKNCFAKQLGSNNPLNNARATVKGLAQMRTAKEVAEARDMTLEELFSA